MLKSAYRKRDDHTTSNLSEAHRRMLYDESGISPEVAAERGYYTARWRSEVPEALKDYQRRPGLVIPVLTPSGERRVRLRPDQSRKGKDGRIRKYEQVAGVGCVLDVHPRNLDRLRDPAVPLWVVEGEKKGDALTSRGECAGRCPACGTGSAPGRCCPIGTTSGSSVGRCAFASTPTPGATPTCSSR